jgi:hypothetical protein
MPIPGRVEPRHAAQPDPGQGGEGRDARLERRGRVTQVRPETDVGPDAPHWRCSYLARLVR